ncbi:MAG: phosphate ABC transporter substrate-binding/OmpA family protein [Elusimicrobiota bacterium]
MNKKIAFFAAFLVLGTGGLLALKFLKPRLDAKRLRATSDAKGMKGTITVGVDNWVGYFPLCSPEMKKRMRGAKYLLQCVDDEADYPGRMKKLARKELDFAVATVDSFLINGAPESFPGAIVAVIDESKGGDAIVANQRKVKSIDDLKNVKGLRIAFTPNSPSEHLLKSVAVHFDIPLLRDKRGAWRVESRGSSEALEMLRAAKADAAVLWEPDVSRATARKDMIKLLGTENTRRLIVDILLVNRDFLVNKPEAVKVLLANYFRTLKTYRDDPELLRKELILSAKLKTDQVDAMLKGVAWATLYDNAATWFGIGTGSGLADEGLVDTIESTVQILVENGDFAATPVPQGDPYQLQNRSFIEDLFKTGVSGQFGAAAPADSSSLKKDFAPLQPAAWNRLREVGTLKILPITFQSGTSDLDQDGKAELDKAASHLRHYPNFRVVLKGHTGIKGDSGQNRLLSEERAKSVQRYLTITHDIDDDRLRALGLGSSAPLPRKPGESSRAFNYRLPRVELYLVAESL